LTVADLVEIHPHAHQAVRGACLRGARGFAAEAVGDLGRLHLDLIEDLGRQHVLKVSELTENLRLRSDVDVHAGAKCAAALGSDRSAPDSADNSAFLSNGWGRRRKHQEKTHCRDCALH
jgi:hypothetical protein